MESSQQKFYENSIHVWLRIYECIDEYISRNKLYALLGINYCKEKLNSQQHTQ